ncbi:hypothetical protein [Modestobacter excelsi]|uniref:hypothetical protein n=1 Tax=Modestobacter excelsi TaxID=2213161 RepID=UPI00110D1075|nr:hypothetical protein [Modestobacter excelsi]
MPRYRLGCEQTTLEVFEAVSDEDARVVSRHLSVAHDHRSDPVMRPTSCLEGVADAGWRPVFRWMPA